MRDHETDYQKGAKNGDYCGERDAEQDIEAANEYGTSYNDEPVVSEGDDPYSEEYIQGYKNAYDIKFKERSLYHAATFALIFDELWSEHQPQYNREIVKSLDSYYTEGVPESDSPSKNSSESVLDISSQTSSDSSSSSKAQSSSQAANSTKTDTNPATGNATPPTIALIVTAGIVIVSEKKKYIFFLYEKGT